MWSVHRGPKIRELLVPMHSLTPLICPPISNDQNGNEAIWFKDGNPLARVKANTNFVLHSHSTFIRHKVPEVGYLVLSHITLEDEGDYWCMREDTEERSEITRIRITYLKKFSHDQKIQVWPKDPQKDDTVILDCPKTGAFPETFTSWKIVSPILMFTVLN